MEHMLATPLEELLQQHAPDAGDAHPPGARAGVAALAAAARAHVPAYPQVAAPAAAPPPPKEPAAAPPPPKEPAAGGDGADPLAGVPFLDKANYFRAFPLAARCWGGTLAGADFVHFSSGSSGEPTPWARCADDEAEVAARFEQVAEGGGGGGVGVAMGRGGSGGREGWERATPTHRRRTAPRQVLRDSFGCAGRSSLCVVALPLGSW
jgi:hypothetical protein